MATDEPIIGVIGGSGLYEMSGLTETGRVEIDTPYGAPSDAYVLGELGGRRLAFLPRHGAGHRILPSELNFRANIYGFKKLGADVILSVSAVGSLREEIKPGDVVVPDQFIDRTRGRISTFFGDGVVAHVSFADPFCPVLSATLARAAREAGATVHEGGTYVCMEGPQFSTRAESHLYRSWGGDVIGMTNLQEAKLAREAEICFATLALATDYDCWRSGDDDVAIGDVLAVLRANAQTARATIAAAATAIEDERSCGCRRALEHAVITDRDKIPTERLEDLAVIAGRVLSSEES
ncbi:MAG: S-methyl-5'-thioadenosine phosphorylase [Candidatus Dadabacteria bacterium]|nr:MAG: S-methyl-5'-thioadenosine phosphorylase [Candidatus Dadabacteria bacterium]